MPKSRSRLYPILVLLEAFEAIVKIREQLGAGLHSKDEIAGVFRYRSGASGPANRKLAALLRFALLVKGPGGYELSELAEDYLQAIENDSDTQGLMQQAFLSVAVFSEVFEYCAEFGQVPRNLDEVLGSRFGIADNAREEVATIFLESAFQCQLIDRDGKFSQSSGVNEEYAIETRTYDLTDGKKAILPSNLNRLDLKILGKHLEALEMLLNDSSSNTLNFPRRAKSHQ